MKTQHIIIIVALLALAYYLFSKKKEEQPEGALSLSRTVPNAKPATVARNAGWENFICRFVNSDAWILGYTKEDVKRHCAEYVLDGGPIHIG